MFFDPPRHRMHAIGKFAERDSAVAIRQIRRISEELGVYKVGVLVR
jgi:hypothetical protein